MKNLDCTPSERRSGTKGDVVGNSPSRAKGCRASGGVGLFADLPYNKLLKERARELRKAGNLAEVLLWRELKNRKLLGLDFTRQKVIGNFIVDFFCAKKRVVIEVDGGSHNQKVEQDKERDNYMEALGLTIIRILDSDVKRNLGGVVKFLTAQLA